MLGLIAPLASLLGIEITSLRERLQRRTAVYGAVGIFALVVLMFLLVAANAALSQWVGPVIAPLIIAGTALALALVALLIGYLQDAAAARREAEEKQRAQTAALLTSVATTAVPLLMKSTLLREVGIPVGGALFAAWLLTRKSGSKATTPPPER